MFEHAAKLNFEGIVSKKRAGTLPLRSERRLAEELKIKSVQKGKFPVIGFVKDPTGVAALYLGKREGKDLVYMGEVGTGWSRTVSSGFRKQLETVVSPKPKLTKQIKKPKATWVEPIFFADVEYQGPQEGVGSSVSTPRSSTRQSGRKPDEMLLHLSIC